jgi:hypothetical protein
MLDDVGIVAAKVDRDDDSPRLSFSLTALPWPPMSCGQPAS